MSRHPLMYVLTATLLASAPLGCAYDTGEATDPELIETEYVGGIDPIIFVHGCTPPDATDDVAAFLFEPMKDYFRSKGYPESYLVSFVNQGPQCQTNAAYASQLATLVSQVRAATGAPRVDIVAHSMGSLATRLYIKQGGNKFVRDFVGVGGTNHGTFGGILADLLYAQDAFGGYPWFEGAQELFPPYACAGETFEGSADVQFAVNGCLTPTGRTVTVDETPNGGVDYLSIRNTQDEVVDPVASSCLNQRFQNDCSDSRVNTAVSVPAGECFYDPSQFCPAHLTMLWDPGVIGKTYAFVAHSDDGNDTSSAGTTGAPDDDSD